MVKIDVRKLISFGKGSYIVSMPKSWIQKNNLKKGDLISVNDDGFELVLRAKQEENKADAREIDIDAKGKNTELIEAEIVSSYLNGYDTINIIFDNHSKEAPRIKDILRNLSGLEIMEQTSTRIMAKNLINMNEISLKNIIRRMDIITRAMIEDSIQCCTGDCTYESIHDRDVDMNRLYFLGYRVIKNALKNPRLAKSLGTDPWQLHSDTLIMLRLEKIADSQKRVARALCNNQLDRTMKSDLATLHTNIGETYNEVMKSYYNQDRILAFKVETTNRERVASFDRFLEKYTQLQKSSKNKNSILVTIAKVVEYLKATSAHVKSIARVVLCYE